MMAREVYDWANSELHARGVRSRPLTMILYGMAIGDVGYKDAMESYAEFCDEVAERMHATCCQHMLVAGIERQPGEFLMEIREKGGWRDANRVSFGPRG